MQLNLQGPPPLAATLQTALAILLPPPKLTISEWADRNRVLSSEASAEPGQWNTSRAEYLRGIMDAMSDPLIERVACMTASQIGKTEALLNVCGFHIHHDPAPILVLQPTVEMAQTWSKDRLAPMVRDTPAIRGKVADARARDANNTTLHKGFPGGHLTIAGANSAASLSARPIRLLLCDEVDRYPASAGTEGDPVALARKRTGTFWNRKQVEVSSPTTEGTSRIAAAYALSDRRRFWVPCPHCGELQTLDWPQVRWDGSDAETSPPTARYHCIQCDAGWTDQQRWSAVRKGQWVAAAPFNGFAGFQLSELYSPWRRLAQIVREFIEAKGKPERLKVFTNTVLAETWREQGEAPDWQRLIERREPFPMGVVPANAVVVTAGVDNQRDRLEVYVWAWWAGFESALIDTRTFEGDPTSDVLWNRLAEYLADDIPVEGGGTQRIERIGVDTGGLNTAAMYSQLRRLHDHRYMPLKGVDGWNKSAPVTGPTLVDVLENGRKLKRGIRLWTVAVSTFKADLYRRLWLTRDGVGYPPGWVHLPEGLEPEAVQQLVAEQLVTVQSRTGFARHEWQKLRPRNEALDCAVYARAALSVLGADRYGENFWKRRPRRAGVPVTDDLQAPPAAQQSPEMRPPSPTPEVRQPASPSPTPGRPKPLGSRFA